MADASPTTLKVQAFPATRWTVIVDACGRSAKARAALAELCEAYWYPLYAFVRRRGHGPIDAQDLTQEFFRRVIEDGRIGRADRSRGRFRTFLSTAMKNFLINEWRRSNRLKRKPRRLFSIDAEDGERRYLAEPARGETAEQLLERRWALEVIDRARQKLRGEYQRRGKGALFEAIEPCLSGEAAETYREIAERFACSEGAVKTAVHRLKGRFRKNIRDLIADTVADEAEIDDELGRLFAALQA